MAGEVSAESPWHLGRMANLERVGSTPIGEGGAAVVWCVRDKRDGRRYALKQWRYPLDEQAQSRFFRECELQASLSGQPNVLRLFTFDRDDEGRALVLLELCDGSLEDRLAAGQLPLGWEEKVKIGVGICAGIAAIHQHGHLHRDMKPANVLLCGDVAKVADLGLALAVGRRTEHGAAGTAGFLAPELLRSPEAQPTKVTDVYATGMTLLRLFGRGAPAPIENLLTRACSDTPQQAL
jgi:serine/threonine protein kinase